MTRVPPQGNWSNDRRQGTGVHWYAKVAPVANGLPNAEKYSGEFSDDKIQGKVRFGDIFLMFFARLGAS